MRTIKFYVAEFRSNNGNWGGSSVDQVGPFINKSSAKSCLKPLAEKELEIFKEWKVYSEEEKDMALNDILSGKTIVLKHDSIDRNGNYYECSASVREYKQDFFENKKELTKASLFNHDFSITSFHGNDLLL